MASTKSDERSSEPAYPTLREFAATRRQVIKLLSLSAGAFFLKACGGMAVPEAYNTSFPADVTLTSRLSSGQDVTYSLWVRHDSGGVYELFAHQPELVQRKLNDVFRAIQLSELVVQGNYVPPADEVRECLYDLHQSHFGTSIRGGWMETELRILYVED